VIGSTRQVAVYAYSAPVDLRKGFDGLSALVLNDLGRDPLAGDFFVFANRTRKRAKVLRGTAPGSASTPSASNRGASRVCGATRRRPRRCD